MLRDGFSALQRAEIAEIFRRVPQRRPAPASFSALQRAEIAEMIAIETVAEPVNAVSVLFNEPKLLKSALRVPRRSPTPRSFQCSSTSRNC